VLTVQLFGVGQVQYEGQYLAGFPNRQSYLLLCYLLLNRQRMHNRERLAAVFWGDYSTASSRKRLRHTLWQLRSALQSLGAPVDQYLSIGEESVAFLDSSAVSLDVKEFESIVERFRDVEGWQLPADQALELERAAALYTGDLLEGVYEDWCLYDRERLSLLYLNTLGKLTAFHEAQGTYERGLEFARQVLARDPTREVAHRQLMRIYWLLGDRHEALAQYKLCSQILHEEMGIDPTPKTKLLYERMVHGKFDPSQEPVYLRDHLPGQNGNSESIQPVARQLLERLNHLEAITDETSTELHDLKHLMNALLVTASHS
jgi:DNA-binding SARP family transcriptional activator